MGTKRTMLMLSLGVLGAVACDRTSMDEATPDAGRSPGTGGVLFTGGALSTGGALATGGVLSSGGVLSTGGVVFTGGVLVTGGEWAAGGYWMITGGTKTGGKVATGGVPQTGGIYVGGQPGTTDAGLPDSRLPNSSSDALGCLNRFSNPPVFTVCCPMLDAGLLGLPMGATCDASWVPCTPFDGSYCTCSCFQGKVSCGC